MADSGTGITLRPVLYIPSWVIVCSIFVWHVYWGACDVSCQDEDSVTPPSPEACGRVWDLEPDCNTVPFFVIVSLLFSCESGKCNNAINQKIAYEK